MRPLPENLSAWKSAVITPFAKNQVELNVVHILRDYSRYENVGKMFGIPAWVIAVIHYRESTFDFTTWLANGDPIIRHGKPVLTTHVPRGLGPAFSWENAAEISLVHQGWNLPRQWDIANALNHLESYNGWGYQKRGVVSPYIWSGTNHYHVGKYTSDGHYDPAVRDKQLGCAALALGLKTHGIDVGDEAQIEPQA